MIDKSGKWWVGETQDDIDEYLVEYSGDNTIETKQIKCGSCGCDALYLRLDRMEGAIQVVCSQCKQKKILLDGEEVWKDAKPKACHCPVCKRRTTYQLKAGFIRRDNGDVKHVFIGTICTECRTLGSVMDYRVNYGPTDAMENNL